MYILILFLLFYLPQKRQNLFFCAGTFRQCLHTSTQGRSGPDSCAELRSFLLGGCSTAQGTSPCGKAVLLSHMTSQEIPLRRCYFICWALSSGETPECGVAGLKSKNVPHLLNVVQMPSAWSSTILYPTHRVCNASLSTVVKLQDFCPYDR